MKDFLRALGIVVIAALGSVVIVVLLIFATQRLTEFSLTPAHFLPQFNTTALVNRPNERVAFYADAWMNGDDTVNGKEAVAWMNINNENLLMTIFEKNASGKGAYGAYDTKTSDENITALMATSTPRLTDDPVFEKLTEGWNAQTSWMFLRMRENETDPLLRVLYQHGYRALALTEDESALHMRLFGEDKPYAGSIAMDISQRSNETVIRLLNMAPLWRSMQETFDASAGLVTNGLLDAKVQNAFGEEVSFTENMQPLLQNEGTLYLRRNESGSLLYALEMENDDDFAKKLHAAYAQQLPRIRTVEKMFDERFPSIDLRIDPSIVRQAEEQMNGWTVRTTRHETMSGGFFSMQKDSELVLGNDHAMLTELINDDKKAMPRGSTLTRGTLFAGGRLHTETVRSILENEMPGFTFPLESPILSQLTGSVLWSLEQKGPVTTLLIQREK